MHSAVKYLPAEERRAMIVEAVLALAAEQNPNGITTAAMAKRMGLTQGALFRHFPNKAAILQAVMDWVTERLLAKLDEAIQEAASPLAALRAMFMTHMDFVAKHPGVPRLLFGELQSADLTPSKEVVQTFIRGYRERLHRLIEKGKADKDFAPNLDTEAAAILFIGTIQGLVMQSLLAGDVDRILHDAPRVFALYHRGIRRAQ
ncbi:TetR family transcriptional regulator [Desulfopila sp. IMCC35006]|uniref:TetR/AcrR family transcriptional regulator n=1 Tax=Desulfopila sp. IMCC35006 TaxID=2569542 RepID=UPI0010AD58FE|nr:TetR family transcriptional regulator [Desulfopila sp. IMCC35006]TKB28542.1 TetR family transcriptional regulator [Desulfopila sp. IMCC35006]